MKVLVVWSSVTGNTEKIARAVAKGCPQAQVLPVAQAPDPAGFDRIFLGFWCDKGLIDEPSRDYLGTIREAAVRKGTPIEVAFFGTLGGNPQSEKSLEWLERKVSEETGDGSAIVRIGARMWQGKIAPAVVEMMNRMMPMTPERRARIDSAASHPDENDELQAAQWAAGIMNA